MWRLFPSRTPFIPTKCIASLYRYTTAPTIFVLHFSLRHALSGTASLLHPCISPLLANESEKFFTPCKCLAYGKMSVTQRAVLRNILRADLVCI